MTIPKLVGILNVTPDSFSDGGKYNSLDNALKHTEKLIRDGADIIDIGAESTRPNAEIIGAVEEWNRLNEILSHVIKIIKANNKLSSIDTYHPETANKAIDLGIDIINDVSGSIYNSIKDVSKKIVIMHNLGVPSNPKIIVDPENDALKVVIDWAEIKIKELLTLGFSKDNIIFDPGIGFGKNAMQSMHIIKNISKFNQLGVEILIGHSRKSFYNLITKVDFRERDLETHITSIYLANKNIAYLRVHDIAGTKRAFNIADELCLC